VNEDRDYEDRPTTMDETEVEWLAAELERELEESEPGGQEDIRGEEMRGAA
jgi:hypothetical protein